MTTVMENLAPTLPYDDAVMRISTGDLVFVGGAKSLFSWAITAVTRSSFSHVGIAVWMYDTDKRKPTLMILEAASGGRRLVNLAFYGRRRPMTVVRSPVAWPVYRDSLLEGTGAEPYGYLDLIGIGIKELFGIKTSDFNGEVCSEMVATVLNRHGFPIEETISPGKLYTELTNRGCPIKAITTPN